MINIEELNDEELRLAIELIPKKDRFNFVKAHSNRFVKITKGVRVDYSSKLLEQRIPDAFFEKVKEQDKDLIGYINKSLFVYINTSNKSFSHSLEHEEELSGVLEHELYAGITDDSIKINKQIGLILKTSEKKYYIRMILKLLDYIEPKYIYTYFSLNKVKLKVKEKNMLKDAIEETVRIKNVEEKVKKDAEKKYEYKISEIENKYKSEIELLKRNSLDVKNKYIQDKKRFDTEQNKSKKIMEEKDKVNLKLQKIIDNLTICKEDLESKVKELKESYNIKVEESEKIQRELQSEVSRLTEDLKLRYNDYSEKYKSKFEEDNFALLTEEEELKENIERLNAKVKELQNEVIELAIESTRKETKLKEYNELVENFVNNLDKEMILNELRGITSSSTNNKSTSISEYISLYIKEYPEVETSKIESCTEIGDVSLYLYDNLGIIGVDKMKNELSDYIISLLAAKMIPLIKGFKTREIAKAISYSYCGQAPAIIAVPSNFNNIHELINAYKNCKSEVVLIEGLVGQMNEYAMLTLFKEYQEENNSDKILLISCEDNRMIDLLSHYMHEFVGVVEVNSMQPSFGYEFVCSDIRSTLCELRKKKLNIKGSNQDIKTLVNNVENNNSYIMSRTLILSYLNKVLEDRVEALETLIKVDTKVIFKDEEWREVIIENINSFDEELEEGIMDNEN